MISHKSDKARHAWSIEQSRKMYGIEHWGNGYFGIDTDGSVIIKDPCQSETSHVSLMSIVEGMRERDLNMPVLLRIENILDQSISLLNETFTKVIDKVGYNNKYQGVYPIKVNQQAQIVEEIAQFGARYQHGFEVGSKAEMIAALSTIEELGSFIICNGYKDKEFIELGLEATKLGFKCFFVIETLTELPIIVACSRALGIRPHIGLRAKMNTKVSGHWGSTSGERSIFGLSSSQLIEAVDYLKEHHMLDCLELLHCHLGSQIPNIRDIRNGVIEACRYYSDLCKEGAALAYIDLGGGLAVDYTGRQSSTEQSRNYSLSEYCEDIVDTIKTTLDAQDLAHPVIVTESGRATVAYTSVLLFNVLDVVNFEPKTIPEPLESEHQLLKNMREVMTYLTPQRVQECFNDAQFYRDEVRELFKRGQTDLRMHSISETLYFSILHGIKETLTAMERVPEELEGLAESLADIYYGNFSLFQSLPDSWAIDQLFPIMPIHRLDEKPTRSSILADITCDCDGKIERFVVDQKVQSTLPLHSVTPDQEYYLGVFLVGAYQETLGDLHNLFGDTNVVSVRLKADSTFDFVKEVHGDTIEDVLSYVEYQPHEMKTRFRNKVEAAVSDGRINARERQQMVKTFNASMQGYTYYEKEALV